MRVFIALELPEDVRAKIAHVSEILERGGLVNGSFVSKDNLHITLSFLGDVSEDVLKQIKDRLSKINFNSFDLKLEKMGFFPSEKYVKVVWIDVLSDQIEKLTEEINNSLKDLNVFKDNKEFEGHLTIARIKNVKNKEAFAEKVKSLNFKMHELKIDKFCLIKSELTAKGPIYRKLSDFNLK